jgi:hypothetical protein
MKDPSRDHPADTQHPKGTYSDHPGSGSSVAQSEFGTADTRRT